SLAVPLHLELAAAAHACQFLHTFWQRRASAAARTHAVGSPKMRRHALLFRGFRHDGPVERRALADLEPRAEHADLAAVDFDDGLEVVELDDAVPCATPELEGDIRLQTSEQQGHDSSLEHGGAAARSYNADGEPGWM